MAGSPTGSADRRGPGPDMADSTLAPLARLLDQLISDPRARDRAKLELVRSERREALAATAADLRRAVGEARAADPWTSRARPGFLYLMYGLILWSVPVGLVAAADPGLARSVAGAMTAYLRGLPEELYALFGTGYLGYTAARTWGKAKGVEH